MRKNFTINNQILYYPLIFVIIILTFAPFFQVGFTTGDDIEYYLSTRNQMIYKSAQFYANETGRFYFLITKPIYHIPYLIDNFYFTKIIQYSALLFSICLFTMLLKKLLKENKQLILLIFLLFFTFLYITPNYHIPIMAYPFFFTTSFSIFIGSVLFLLKYNETNKNKYLIFSVLLYAIALLFYENYLVFLLFILGYIFIKFYKLEKISLLKNKQFYKEFLPFIGVALLYVIVYIVYKKFLCNNNSYSGSNFSSDFNVKNFFTIIFKYNKVFLPKIIYDANRWWLKDFLHCPNITTIINILLQGFLYTVVFLKIKPNICWKKILYGIIICVLFATFSHILIAVSEKYNNDDYWANVPGYVTTYFSYFAIMVLYGLIFYSILKLVNKIPIIKYIVISIFVCFICYNLFIIGHMNEENTREYKQINNSLLAIDKLAEQQIFSQIPKKSIILASDFYVANNATNIYYNNCIPEYISMRAKKELTIINSPQNFIERINNNNDILKYYVSFHYNKIYEESNTVFSKITTENFKYDTITKQISNLFGNSSEIFYYSKYKYFNLGFYIESTDFDTITFQINDSQPIEAKIGYNQVHMRYDGTQKDDFVKFKISSNSLIDLKKFSISNVSYLDNDNILIVY